MNPELEAQPSNGAFQREPGPDPGGSRASVGRRHGDTGWRGELLNLRSPAAIAAAAGLAVDRRRSHRLQRRMLLAPGKLRAGLVSYRDEERCDVLAVLAGLLEGRARTVRRDAFPAELDGRLVGLRVRALHATRGARVGDVDALDDTPLLVVETSEERARAEQSSKAAVG